MLYTKRCQILAKSMAYNAAPSNMRSHLLYNRCNCLLLANITACSKSAGASACRCGTLAKTCPRACTYELAPGQRPLPMAAHLSTAPLGRRQRGMHQTWPRYLLEQHRRGGSFRPDASLSCHVPFRITSADARCVHYSAWPGQASPWQQRGDSRPG